MYLEHYGLREPPFSITPDPRFVFLSERHRDALAHLLFGIGQGGSGGFVQLTGEVGTGKTTLCRLLLEQLPADCRVALILNPRLTPVELLETLCEELHIDIDGRRGSAKSLVDSLNHYLLDAYAQGLRIVLIIDEAQDLSIEALEQVRLLTNLETDTQKLLQIILLGQPELRTLLARSDLRQLSQRITARFHLTPLDAGETERYLRHRHAIAGGIHLPFSRSAIKRLHARSGGVPRLINVLAERSLLAGYARDTTRVDAGIVELAAREALPQTIRNRAVRPLLITAAVIVVVAAAWATPWARRTSTMPIARTEHHLRNRVVPVTKPPIAPLLDDAGLQARVTATNTATSDASWRALLAAWQLPTGVDDVAIAIRCAPILAEDVHCLQGRESLDTLAAIGRPVLLRLHAGDHNAWCLLLGVDARNARVQLGDTRLDVPRVALQRTWKGEYAAIWRDRADQTKPALDSEQLRAFQAAHGLMVDGIAGPETQFAQASDAPGPRLSQGLN
jgi:general secretion pathway protein A